LEIGVFEGAGQFRTNFHVVGDDPREPFSHGQNDRPVNAHTTLSLTVFTQINIRSRLSSSEVHFLTENGRFAF